MNAYLQKRKEKLAKAKEDAEAQQRRKDTRKLLSREILEHVRVADEIIDRMELSTYTSGADFANATRALRKAMDVAMHDDELYIVLKALSSSFDELRTAAKADRPGARRVRHHPRPPPPDAPPAALGRRPGPPDRLATAAKFRCDRAIAARTAQQVIAR